MINTPYTVRVTWAVVVPTNRPERFADFFSAWGPLFEKHRAKLIVVQDLPESDPGIVAAVSGGGHFTFCRKDLPAWIPTGTDMVRSHGILAAWRLGGDYVLSLDDDTLPDGDVFAEYEAAFEAGAPCSPYLDVGALTDSGLQMRGFPYRDRVKSEVAIQYGGWHGVLDYDAATQLVCDNEPRRFAPVVMPVPKGVAVTGCAMNMAWRSEFSVAMWQLPLWEGRYNRYGDIWAGLFAKRTMDALGKAVVVNGRASVKHERASDPTANLVKELPGVEPNSQLWDAVATPFARELHDVYRQVTDDAHGYFAGVDPDYARHFLRCRNDWLGQYV